MSKWIFVSLIAIVLCFGVIGCEKEKEAKVPEAPAVAPEEPEAEEAPAPKEGDKTE
ncbi:MAG: hypothetical protein HQ592_02185 [Planctomycetes bacterium]|nr:hypothetical protein [Planctomycetota bacterium]